MTQMYINILGKAKVLLACRQVNTRTKFFFFSFLEIGSHRAGDIISLAYVSARTKQPPPKNADIWVRRTLELFAVRSLVPRINPRFPT